MLAVFIEPTILCPLKTFFLVLSFPLPPFATYAFFESQTAGLEKTPASETINAVESSQESLRAPAGVGLLFYLSD